MHFKKVILSYVQVVKWPISTVIVDALNVDALTVWKQLNEKALQFYTRGQW